jgi:hypothetical protein
VSLVSHWPCRVPDGKPSPSVAFRVPQSKKLDLMMPSSGVTTFGKLSQRLHKKAKGHPTRASNASRTMTKRSQLHPSSWDRRHTSPRQASTVESDMSLISLLSNSTNIGLRRGQASVASPERRRLRVHRDLASILDEALAISDAFLERENNSTN